MRPADGCFVQPKHVAAIGIPMIKVLCRRNTCILLRVLQSQGGYHTLKTKLRFYGKFITTSDIR